MRTRFDATIDLYAILGVQMGADQRTIEVAYRRLCRRFHPDVSREPDAEVRMREINAAYEVLRDRSRRLAYDRTRTALDANVVAWEAARRVWKESVRAPAGAPPRGAQTRPEVRARVTPGAIDFGFIARD